MYFDHFTQFLPLTPDQICPQLPVIFFFNNSSSPVADACIVLAMDGVLHRNVVDGHTLKENRASLPQKPIAVHSC